MEIIIYPYTFKVYVVIILFFLCRSDRAELSLRLWSKWFTLWLQIL